MQAPDRVSEERHDPRAKRCAVAILAKVPRAGLSKTRLCPPLSPEGAAALAGAFLADTARLVGLAAAHVPIDLFVAFAPVEAAALFAPWLPPATAMLAATGDTVTDPGVQGFGRVLLEAMRRLFARGYGAVAVLNADGPTLPPGHLVDAAHHLLAGPPAAVLGPSVDGGYYLLGLTEPLADPFRAIAWSTDGVAAATRARLRQIGLAARELPIWYDVDDAEGLARLQHDLAAGADAPDTRAALGRLGHLVAAGRPGVTAAEG